MAEARVVRREAAERQRRKRVHHRVEAAHAAEPVTKRARRRDADVHEPQRLRRILDARGEPALLEWPRRLRIEDLAAADAEQRQYRDGEHDEPHAAEPLQKTAPEIDRR